MTTKQVQPYLFFGGRCEEALDFYRDAIGAEIEVVMLYKDSPEPMPEGMLSPGFEDKVMHASFKVAGDRLMASDGSGKEPGFGGFSLSLSLPTAAEVDKAFAALSEGGKVMMPLTKTFWSPRFGMLADKFGLGWMVGIEPGQPEDKA